MAIIANSADATFKIPPKINFVIGFPNDRETQELLFMEAAGEESGSLNSVWCHYCLNTIEACLTKLNPLESQAKTDLGFDRYLDSLASKVIGRDVILPQAEGHLKRVDGNWTDINGHLHEKQFFYPVLVLLGHHCLLRSSKEAIMIDADIAAKLGSELKTFFKSTFVDVSFEAARLVPTHKPVSLRLNAP